ncbi:MULTISPECIES: arginase [Hydrogenibacillus]|nr:MULTISPECIES: arginase [Hydrogenibacillus]MBT9282521.1 arginase [Hydrogenibacillus schlegelii]QZA34097.1 arginase [Hydrogenibacillus sp. N12]
MDVAIIGGRLDLGAGRRGVEMGPAAIRTAGLREHLVRLGHRIVADEDVALPEGVPVDVGDPTVKYADAVAAVAARLSETVREHLVAGAVPVVLGGDHSLAIGSIAGAAAAAGGRLGVIWIDAHGDVNTPETTPSGNIHGMPLAVALGYGDARLVAVGGPGAKVRPEAVVMLGLRDLDPGEKAFIRRLGLQAYTMHDIDRYGMSAVLERALSALPPVEALHVSLDLDALDPSDAPGVGTPVPGGITYREAHLAMEMLYETGLVRSVDVVEVNPILDERNRTAIAAVRLVGSLLGDRLL